MTGQETIDALLFLATYCKNKNNLQEAQYYCQRLLDYAGKVTTNRASLNTVVLTLIGAGEGRGQGIVEGDPQHPTATQRNTITTRFLHSILINNTTFSSITAVFGLL